MSNTKVVVNLGGRPAYDVRIGTGLLEDVGRRVTELLPAASRAVVVSDTNVAPLYGQQVRQGLQQAGLPVKEITVPAGEQSKSLDVLAEVWRALADSKLDRDCCIVALGGGVVGDLAGFAAATYLRGVPYIQVPTSLLAMVDSSVGGKTAVDLPEGKNLVGAFKQPAYVCADLQVLSTLPGREWACGLGEVAKSAVIDSDEFFFWLVEHAHELAARDADAVQQAVTRCVVFKAGVVAADEQERRGVRECLNYGHTLGHAIEVLAGYGAVSHGAAVAEGMRFAVRLAAAQVGAGMDFVQAQDALLDNLGLPALEFGVGAEAGPVPNPEQLLACMHSDKKARKGQLRFVLPDNVGSWQVHAIEDEVVLDHLQAWAASKE